MNRSRTRNTATSARVLIVDDELAVRSSLHEALSQDGIAIEEATSGEEALEMLSRSSFELVLTDIRMNEMSGLDLLAKVKDQWPDTVVILLTGYASLDSAIQALRQGAHDYLIKPASIHEVRTSVREGLDKRQEMVRRRDLVARLREDILELTRDQDEEAVATRDAEPAEQADEEPTPQCVRVGNLSVDKARYLVTMAGIPVNLTTTEYRLLVSLLDSRGHVVGYQELVQMVHGYACDPFEARQLIIPHMSNLRRKLRTESGGADLIENVRGIGYIFP
jgi:DNA-binding response OmpR family regulator